MADSSQDQRRESPGQHQHQHQGQHQHQQPHIHRPIPRRAFSPQIPHDNADADSPTHAFSQQPQPQPHSPTASSLQSSRSSDFLAQLNARLLRTYNANANAEHDAPESPVDAGGARITATKSFLNMNSSTLFGIYDDVSATTTHGVASVADTPWGTGAETPGHTAMGWSGTGTVYDAGGADAAGLSMKPSARRGSVVKGKGSGSERRGSSQSRRARSRSRSARAAVRAAKLAALFTFGVLYGTIVSHLHDTRHLAAVHVKGVDRESWFYMTTWGFAGVALGSLLPYVDLVWGGRRASTLSSRSGVQVQVHVDEDEGEDKDAESPLSEQINDVVRSVAAFLGVAFAIRRLPWQSTLQLTLTLALVNPALWYILDRSKPGLSCSLLVTSLLTSLIFLSNPSALPSPQRNANAFTSPFALRNGTGNATARGGDPGPPATAKAESFAGIVSYDTLAVVTWVGSVLFCSCVCFGSIGRRLAVLEGGWRR